MRHNPVQEQESPFDFLKSGKNEEFQNAMNSIQVNYDDMFGDISKYDKMFETFKTENNPITAPIDKMSQQIFNSKFQKQEKYVKAQGGKIDKKSQYVEDDDEESFAIGEPVYQNNYGNQQRFTQDSSTALYPQLPQNPQNNANYPHTSHPNGKGKYQGQGQIPNKGGYFQGGV